MTNQSAENRTGERGVDAPNPALTTNDNRSVDMADGIIAPKIYHTNDDDVVVEGRPATSKIAVYANAHGQIVLFCPSLDLRENEDSFVFIDPRDASALCEAIRRVSRDIRGK